MGILARVMSAFQKKDVGWWAVSANAPMNWWQIARPVDQGEFGLFGPVYACWAIIAQEVSRVPLHHHRFAEDGAATRVTTQAPARVLRSPNTYQTRSDFLLYIVRSLLADGNAYAYAVRNARYEVSSLYPVNPRRCYPYIAQETGEIYYQVSDSEVAALSQADLDSGLWVPARDMLHIRLFTPGHPLLGETPLVAATSPVRAGMAINQQLAAFFSNAARPSGVIRHPGKLEPAAVQRIKERFMDATTGARAGDPVVFTEGMEWTSLTMNAVDAELIASAKLTQLQIAQIYRVPPFFLGDLGEAKFASVEALTRWFINSGLGFYLDHISDSLTKFFELPANEEILFDYERALLQADFKSYFEALEVGTRSGVLTPNEARRMRNLPPVEHGDEPRVQQQLVPLSYGAELMPNATAAAPAPLSTVEPDEDDVEDDTPDPERQMDPFERDVRVEMLTRRLLA